MSRIGRLPIEIPAGVEVKIDGCQVEVKGPKGVQTKQFSSEIGIAMEDGHIVVTRSSEDANHRALHGLTRALIANMVKGVTTGFAKNLELIGVGYRAAKQGTKLVLNVGYSNPVEMEVPAGLEIEVPAPTKITISGADKEKVGAFAANVRSVRPPEPYKGKGIKYQDEVIRRKAGKTGAKK